jgi:hypothetical protein
MTMNNQRANRIRHLGVAPTLRVVDVDQQVIRPPRSVTPKPKARTRAAITLAHVTICMRDD